MSIGRLATTSISHTSNSRGTSTSRSVTSNVTSPTVTSVARHSSSTVRTVHKSTGTKTASVSNTSTSTISNTQTKSGTASVATATATTGSQNTNRTIESGVIVSIGDSNRIVKSEDGVVTKKLQDEKEVKGSERRELDSFYVGRSTETKHRDVSIPLNDSLDKKDLFPLQNRLTFTGESIYSINNKWKDKAKDALIDKMIENVPPALNRFIQKNIGNDIVLSVLNALREKGIVKPKIIVSNRIYNEKAIEKMIDAGLYKNGKYINNQVKWSDIKFGDSYSIAHSGCEIIATYNAQIALGEKLSGAEFIKMISEFEADGAVFQGAWGVAPTAIKDYLDEKYKNDENINISMYIPGKKKDEKIIDKVGNKNDVFIATVYNNTDKITDQIHTVCIKKEKDIYTIYNAGMNGDKGYESLSDAIDGISSDNPQLISLIAIENTKS